MATDVATLAEDLRRLLGPSLPPWARVSTTPEALTIALRGDLKARFARLEEGFEGSWLTTFPIEDLEVEDDAQAPRMRATLEAAAAALGMDATVELHQRRLDFGWVPVAVVRSAPTAFGPEDREAMAAHVLGAGRWREAVVGTLTAEARGRWVP